MSELLQKYKERPPAIVFEWNDHETEAKGWVVINSLRGGAAGGGTRMRLGLDKAEVESLAKVMEIKFTVSGPAIGGAKSGINFDPRDPRREEVLRRWFRAVSPLLKQYYGTGGDMNVDEVKDVIPITEDYGLWHPQEGIVNGHFQPRDNQKIHLIGQLRQGVTKIVEDPKYTPSFEEKMNVSDLITGYGVAESIRHYYQLFHNSNLEGKRVIVQGWGNVAGTAGYYLAQEGAKIVGIIDKDCGLIHEDGMDYDRVKELLKNRDGNKLSDAFSIPFEECDKKIWDVPADIFVPAAASRLVTKDHLDRMLANGLEVISAGANVPFKDEDVFFGETAQYADAKLSVIPDFIANCGMARAFAYLMQGEVEISDQAIFGDISQTIYNALNGVIKRDSSKTNITRNALDAALNKIL